MSFRLEFEIQGLPKTTNGNARRHWRALHAEATKWKKVVGMAFRQESNNRVISNSFSIPSGSFFPMAKAKLTLTRYSSKEPDFDGLCSSFKNVIDGLVEAGVIIDDKMSVIGQPTYAWVKCPPKKGKIKVVVEEL